jgi:hypothetical protein
MTLRLRFGAASRPIPGESECGDQWGVETIGDVTTFVLADGIGHGVEAAHAAKRAVAFVRAHGHRPLDELVAACHEDLRGSRGAAMALVRCVASTRSLTFCGVGNVELAALSSARLHAINTPGIVGVRARKFVATASTLQVGDLFVLHTDGISSRIDLDRFRGLEPQPMANAILATHAKGHDDAACIVVRC